MYLICSIICWWKIYPQTYLFRLLPSFAFFFFFFPFPLTKGNLFVPPSLICHFHFDSWKNGSTYIQFSVFWSYFQFFTIYCVCFIRRICTPSRYCHQSFFHEIHSPRYGTHRSEDVVLLLAMNPNLTDGNWWGR